MLVSLQPVGAQPPVLLTVTGSGRWAEPTTVATPDLGVGLWAVPGLVDAHAHLAADRLELGPGNTDAIRRRAVACLDEGVFLVVDKGWSDDSVVLALTDTHPSEAPDWEGASRMIAAPDGYFPGFATETDAAGLTKAVSASVERGRGWVKLVGDWPRRGVGPRPNFDEASLAAAVRVAHAGGARVAIHTMAPEVPSMAVRAGVDSIEHGLFLTGDDLAALAARGGAWVPTVVRMEETAAALGVDSSGRRLISEGLDNVSSLLQSVPDGVSVLAGSDLAMAPGKIGKEVVRLVELGLDPSRAVAASTHEARLYLGRRDGFEVGQPADAVFYRTDPREDPSVLLEPSAVMRSGAVR
ncbi:amidohydrolase family protein [soil metagenome]